MARRFTGKHMLLVMLGFFGVIIAVNFIMARYAISTFGGTVVENSYVASQRFNRWLADARDQQALGWSTAARIDGTRRVTIEALGSDGKPLDGLTVIGAAEHPLGRVAPVKLNFIPLGAGKYRALAPLPGGRWKVRFELVRGKDRVKLLESLG